MASSSPAPNRFKQHQDLLAREQRKLAHKVKFSANWRKQQAHITSLQAYIVAARQDFLHPTSTRLSKNHAMIAVEDLKVANMTPSSRGTIEAPGRRVAKKIGLNRVILDKGWSEFRRQLAYKQQWQGGLLIAVPPQHTSQHRPACRHISPDNRKTQAEFVCVRCDYENHADTVGAINILDKADRRLAGINQPQDFAGLVCEVNGAVTVVSRNPLSAVV